MKSAKGGIAKLANYWIAVALGSWIAFDAVAQAHPQGVLLIDKATKSQVSTGSVSLPILQLESIMAKDNLSLESMLRSKGMEPEPSLIQAVRKFNPDAFQNETLRPGSFLYFPAPKFATADAFKKYTIKYTDLNFPRLQLKHDAFTVRGLGGNMAKLAARSGSEIAKGHATLLQEMATNLEKLGEQTSIQFGPSELSTISFQKDVAEYLTKSSMVAGSQTQFKNLHLLQEVAASVSNTEKAASAVGIAKRIGTKVTIHYTEMPSKKPHSGKQLYAIPLGMKAIPSNFNAELFSRALELGRFVGPTSPSSRMLPWGNFSVIAGPMTVTPSFVEKLMKAPASLDNTTVVVSTTNDYEIEFHLPARYPQ